MSGQADKPEQPTGATEQLAVFKEACKKAGLKVTRQRIAIFSELADSYSHPSAETIYIVLQKKLPTMSFDTVYRTLATFEKHGLISRIQTPESLARYEVAEDSHHHIVCTKCGRITDFNWNSFDASQLPRDISGWGTIDRKNVTLQGVCRKCSR